MRKKIVGLILLLPVLILWAGASPAGAVVTVQCPATVVDPVVGTTTDPNIICKHLSAGDGFITMADGYPMYSFGFSSIPLNILGQEAVTYAMKKAELPGPTITVKEGQKLYLTLTNVGMVTRPDLFDPHTVHFHGFPNASTYFDGEPMASFGINQGSSVTYFYQVVEPGTFMYHCHQEATEHMQMGMLGNLYVTPAQDNNQTLKNLGTPPYTGFVYNDGDGSTGYHTAYPIQIHSMDPDFHDADRNIQPLNFAGLEDRYAMLNGRGYPDTVNPGNILNEEGNPSQKANSRIQATAGQKILLRVSNLSFDFYTLTVMGIPMKVVGKDAKILRGPTGLPLYYNTNSLDLGGGQSADVILDTAGVSAGTYALYTTNLNYLSNNGQDFGGMMTEIVIN
jgi:FtsP/CotA-like multicopper oxidase with cupredoxin domain